MNAWIVTSKHQNAQNHSFLERLEKGKKVGENV
jgi:hypothetical protein